MRSCVSDDISYRSVTGSFSRTHRWRTFIDAMIYLYLQSNQASTKAPKSIANINYHEYSPDVYGEFTCTDACFLFINLLKRALASELNYNSSYPYVLVYEAILPILCTEDFLQ